MLRPPSNESALPYYILRYLEGGEGGEGGILKSGLALIICSVLFSPAADVGTERRGVPRFRARPPSPPFRGVASLIMGVRTPIFDEGGP